MTEITMRQGNRIFQLKTFSAAALFLPSMASSKTPEPGY